MHSSKQPARALKSLLLGVIAALALSALTSASALAAPVPAKWVSPGSASMSGTITTKLNGANAKTCTLSGSTGEAFNVGNEGALVLTENSFFIPGLVVFQCTGSTQLWLRTVAAASYNSGYFLTTASDSGWSSPYGTWSQNAIPMPFTNGSGATPSKVTLSEAKLGAGSSGTITASGTLTIKGKGGSLLSLTH